MALCVPSVRIEIVRLHGEAIIVCILMREFDF